MSRMLRKKDCVPAGTLVQLIAGDSPSPVATPGAAWLNFTGMSAPSANPATVTVIAGAAGAAGAAPRCPAGARGGGGSTGKAPPGAKKKIHFVVMMVFPRPFEN